MSLPLPYPSVPAPEPDPVRRPWLPGAVSAELDDDPRPLRGRRTRRDILVDVLVIALAIGIGVLAAVPQIGGSTLSLWPDLVIGAGACTALAWRRRWPVPIAVVTNLICIPFTAVAGAAYLSTFSLAVHRPLRHAIPVGVLGVIAAQLNLVLVAGATGTAFWVTLAFSILLTGGAIGWGTSVRSRRQLLISLAERARRAESEQRERLAAARAAERERLAREMHDVLAHRMSLLSVHAGALEYRPDAPPEDIARAAGVIRGGVHQMLEDLRDVIGMLRDDSDDLAVRPDSVADVERLFDECRAAGSRITPHVDVDDPTRIPGVVGRAAFRVVQEGLTNARKHAGAVPVAVDIVGGPGRGLQVTVSQPLSRSPEHRGIPGTGTGLTGLEERVTLAGGSLHHGVVEHRFVLEARLPWQSGAIA
ncbi:sensor histidine kinase [Williamsia deligens]|uniref:histidine kinase n=1 Tax=Williamsia deligens TaxID=321325 RepID=A0ABW3G921_9NOCA|nr:histidine kinase [Williamsia deligens]MCP2194003.1 Signal transduction histidine kinase [Williamsia deligens]